MNQGFNLSLNVAQRLKGLFVIFGMCMLGVGCGCPLGQIPVHHEGHDELTQLNADLSECDKRWDACMKTAENTHDKQRCDLNQTGCEDKARKEYHGWTDCVGIIQVASQNANANEILANNSLQNVYDVVSGYNHTLMFSVVDTVQDVFRHYGLYVSDSDFFSAIYGLCLEGKCDVRRAYLLSVSPELAVRGITVFGKLSVSNLEMTFLNEINFALASLKK